MSHPILKLININTTLSEYCSLKNISLNLLKGEVHVIMGENGSGKSSLMNVILGAYPKDSGEILLDNIPVHIQSPQDSKKLGITMIHQDTSLFNHFSVAENIFIDHKPYSMKSLKIIDSSKMYTECEQLFNKLGFSLDSRTIVRNLTVAQKQLVDIAKAYISNARIIIMDEPTSSLTASESELLFNIIRELKKDGVSIFYITHRLDEVMQVGDRISIIRDGEVVDTKTVSAIDTENIINMMSGMDYKERYPKLPVKLGKEVLRVKHLRAGSTLTDISFSLKKQEIFGIIGLVGSGRTKIAKCLFGIDRIESGEIYIDNVKTDIQTPSDAIRSGIGCVTEDRITDGLFMNLNIPQNIAAPNIKKVSKKFIIDKSKENEYATHFIKTLNIKPGALNDKAAYLSGGNQQKTILAKWIMARARIFIMDEPTRGIDIASKVDVYNLMNEMVSKGSTIMLITSDVNEALGMCDRIMVLYAGKVAAILPNSEATKEKIMYYATGGNSNTQ